jgi:hypothetical protein
LSTIPGVKVVSEEYPISYIERSSIDLLVNFESGHINFLLPIECKRGYVEHKRWIFFEEGAAGQSKFHYHFNNKELLLNFANSFTQLGIPLCLEGMEIDTSKTDPYKAGSLSNMYETANQVSRQLMGLLKQELDERNKKESRGYLDYVVFPLLVTNTKLLTCKLDPKLVDISTGNLKDHLKFDQVPYLILSHPFPHIEQIGARHLIVESENYISPQNRGNLQKEGIMVINVDYLPDFFEMLSKFSS